MAFAHLREQYGFSEYALHAYAKTARCTWIASHFDSTMAQTLATRAHQAVNRVCQGQARAVHFKSRRRGLDSVEGKRNDTGCRNRASRATRAFSYREPIRSRHGWSGTIRWWSMAWASASSMCA